MSRKYVAGMLCDHPQYGWGHVLDVDKQFVRIQFDGHVRACYIEPEGVSPEYKFHKAVPIIMQGYNVRAILEGRKSQTRRVVNPQPESRWNVNPDGSYCTGDHERGQGCGSDGQLKMPCKIGEILYVRESWYDHGRWLELDSIPEKPRKWAWESDLHLFTNPTPKFAADFVGKDGVEKEIVTYTAGPHYRKMSSLHLPKKYSRMFLKVLDVRVERLLDISPADAIAEGIKSFRPVPGDGSPETLYFHYDTESWGRDPIHSYLTLWDSIHGAGSSKLNPWVFPITFEHLKDYKNPFQSQ